MRTSLRILAGSAGVLFGLAQGAPAQPPRPGVHRMEVNNGTQQTVRYFPRGLSPGEVGSLREMEAAENDLGYARNLQGLKRQYVRDARQLEGQRRLVQQTLLGLAYTASAGGGAGYGGLGYLGYGYGGYGSNLPAGWGGYYGLGGYAASNYPGLAFGGYTGVYGGPGPAYNLALAADVAGQSTLKAALAPVVAADAAGPSLAQAGRNWDRAVASASGSARLRSALRLAAAPQGPGQVTLVLNDGKEIRGSQVEETKDWVIVTTRGGRTRVRPADVKRIIEGDAGVRGAAAPDKPK
jgi:hypothetical protein